MKYIWQAGKVLLCESGELLHNTGTRSRKKIRSGSLLSVRLSMVTSSQELAQVTTRGKNRKRAKMQFFTFKMAAISQGQGHSRSYSGTKCHSPQAIFLPSFVGITKIERFREKCKNRNFCFYYKI